MIISTITKVELRGEGSTEVTDAEGWTISIPSTELNGFVPQVGMSIVVGPSVGRPIQYINIDGNTLRNVSDDEQAEKHKAMVQSFRDKNVTRFLEEGHEWKAKVETLLPVLRDRIKRFEAEDGDEFWIDMGAYELYAIGAADVLARKAMEKFPDDIQAQLEWVSWWSDLNTEPHGYDYAKQMEILPEFGDGHSGNTFGAAVYYARRAIEGLEC